MCSDFVTKERTGNERQQAFRQTFSVRKVRVNVETLLGQLLRGDALGTSRAFELLNGHRSLLSYCADSYRSALDWVFHYPCTPRLKAF
jgi:hypothetical protein